MCNIAEKLISVTRRRDGKADRGALAKLRRGFSAATRPYAWPVLYDMGLPIDDDDAVLVAALYGEHPCHTDANENLGGAWRQVYHNRKPRGRDDKDSYQTRFRRLISSDRDELADQLLGVVRLAAGSEIKLNYNILYHDLQLWSERTKLCWAKQFYAVQTDAGGGGQQ
jgi:CRISPR type I-E-associated protein CasB/Cse2